jgi:acetyl esterase/lipase
VRKASEHDMKYVKYNPSRLYRPDGSGRRLPAVIFLRGWSPRLPWTYMDLHAWLCAKELGILCLSAQYRGMGSPGNPYKLTRADFFEDALASYDFLKGTEGVDGHNIFIVGESLGGYMASIMSGERELKGMLLRAPADFPDEGFADAVQLNWTIRDTMGWRGSAHQPSESRALKAVRNFAGDVLVVESDRDSLIPHQTIENYLTAAGRAEHIVMKNAGHGLICPLRRREFHRIVLGWLGSQLKK